MKDYAVSHFCESSSSPLFVPCSVILSNGSRLFLGSCFVKVKLSPPPSSRECVLAKGTFLQGGGAKGKPYVTAIGINRVEENGDREEPAGPFACYEVRLRVEGDCFDFDSAAALGRASLQQLQVAITVEGSKEGAREGSHEEQKSDELNEAAVEALEIYDFGGRRQRRRRKREEKSDGDRSSTTATCTVAMKLGPPVHFSICDVFKCECGDRSIVSVKAAVGADFAGAAKIERVTLADAGTSRVR